MSVEDYFINAKVKGILVRHNVDTGKCNCITIKGNVHLRGYFMKAGQSTRKRFVMVDNKVELNPRDFNELRVIQIIDEEIRDIPEVNDVFFELDNLQKDRGKWKER
jgi:hypothetical protein